MKRKKGPVILIIVGAVFLLLVLWIRLSGGVEQGTILALTINGTLPEEEPSGFWDGELFRDLLDALALARDDDRIAGVSLEVHQGLNFAQSQELRKALQEFSDGGKPCAAYLEGGDNLSYYLASACQEVFLTPTSTVYLTGLLGYQTFYRGLLDKLDIYPDMHHIAEYKAARNIYTEKGFTRPHREMVLSILTGWQEQMIEGIAESRQLELSAVEDILAAGPFLASEALERKLVDETLYRDEFLDRLKEKAGTGELTTLSPGAYLGRTSLPGGSRIAVVYATGTIVQGRSQQSAFSGRLMGSETVAKALRTARRDSSIKAIVFRIDSPGGSPLASEIIRREVQLATQEKPVVVSMSNVAGSGGYWIAMSADKIVADPGTLTGSIGVVFGKLNVKGLYNLFGLTVDHIALSPNSTFFYPFENFTPEQRKTLDRLMGDIYQNFLAGVAEGRGMEVEEVAKIAKGRVWLGRQAAELGLVDKLGGLAESVELAKELAGIPAGRSVERVILPRPKSSFERIVEWLDSFTQVTVNPKLLLDLSALDLFREPGLVLMPFSLEVR